MTICKSWMNIQNRASKEYIQGCDTFLEWAFSRCTTGKRIRCPCNRCRNSEFHSRTEVRFHLFNKGFYGGYKLWTHHGEEIEEENQNDNEQMHNEVYDDFDAMIRDACGPIDSTHVDTIGAVNTDSEQPNPEASKFFKLLEDAKQQLWLGCDEEHTKLSFVINILQQKCLDKWTDKSLDRWLKYQKKILPNDALVPSSYYDAKKITKKLGLDYIKIHACLNDYVLYWKEYESLEVCPTCGESRWKTTDEENDRDDDCEDSTAEKIQKQPHKVLRYFPITQRLQRLYMSSKTAKQMRWHKEENVDNGVMKHPADSPAWKCFDDRYPHFSADPRSVRLGLASDGFNPFGNMSALYSIWPVVLVPYNLPPWLCMKQPYFMMSLLIPGKKSPGNDIDVYMQPLIDELKNLWEVGVDSFDAHTQQNFKLHAAVIWTINDFPAYGNLSGWVTKGKLACPCCHVETSYTSLRSKGCYMGHRRWLPNNHRWRNETTTFNGNKEYNCAPKPLSGDDVFGQMQKLLPNQFGKTTKRKKRALNWSKKSIFFELPYWQTLLLRHNLDVMHIERNVSESLLNTMMGVIGKTKDSLKARYDLQDMGLRSELHPFKERGKTRMPNAVYTLSPTEKSKICDFLKEIKVPDGFASNISRRVNAKERKIFGMKCHDHHIFLQRILPFIANGLLKKEIGEPLIELGLFFSELCCKVLDPCKLDELDNKIATTLCKMERVFPPAFFDIMIHLPIHLAREAKIAGPVQYRWMYPVERYLRTLKSYVRNTARPEGSIAEGYILDECMTFCSRYMNSMDTKFNRIPRNDDFVEDRHTNLSIFKRRGLPKGKSKQVHLSVAEFNEARMYMLQNCDEVLPFIEHHKATLVCQNERDITIKHKAQFPQWFHSRVSELYKDGKADINLLNLAMGPHRSVHRYDTYVVNGFRFHTSERERFLKSQNSGVVVKGDVCTNIQEYYGVLKDIYKFSFVGGNEVFLFKCLWWDVSRSGIGCKTDKWGYTYVNSSHSLKTNENFVLAVQAEQVYYVKDINNSQWLAVCKHTPRDGYLNESFSKDDESTEDSTTNDGEPYQNAEVGQSTILDLDDVVEDSRIEGLCRNDFEALDVIEKIPEDFNSERVEDDDNLENDEDSTDFDGDE